MRSPLLLTALTVAHLLGSAAALAQDCEAYTTDQLLADLMVAEQGLRSGQDQVVELASGNLESGLPCLAEMLPQMMVGKTYRAIAAGHYLSADQAEARRWFRVALEVDSTFEYGLQDIPADHPMRRFYAEIQQEPSVESIAVRGASFAPGKHYLDGRLWTEPKATPGLPHLYQHEAEEIRSWVIEGNAFPTALLQEPTALPPTPEPSGRMSRAPGSRSALKTPLIASGVAALVAGGGVYGYSFATRSAFKKAADRAEVERTQRLTNNLVLASGGFAALGLSSLAWGVAIDSTSRTVHVHRAF